ncbi:MAG: aminodeoxychorismate synthase component I [Pseudomonadota bacterium]
MAGTHSVISQPDGDVSCERLSRAVDLRALHRLERGRYPFLLESTAGDPRRGGFDILFAAGDERLVLERGGELAGGEGKRFLDALDAAWIRERSAAQASHLPFTGGWFLYLGYELAAEVEPGLDLPADDLLPVAFAVRCRAAVIREQATDQYWLVAEDSAADELERLRADIAATRSQPAAPVPAPATIAEAPADQFLAAVAAAREYIAAGDIYQANLSRAWQISYDTPPDPASIYSLLASANPAPFAGSVAWRDKTVISSSPERLLSVRSGRASTRPIAGTRPRSSDADRDLALSGELFNDPKERAEHIMLIDLERNDLGRICEPGSVTVDEMMILESYAHVHHIVSNIEGRLRADVSPGQAIAAVFPGGTITGCPKVRCMQIIAELEGAARGAYTGSFGYLNRDGSLDLNILIRTMVHDGRSLRFSAGSGIVADSQAEPELAETRAKAEGLLRAIGS